MMILRYMSSPERRPTETRSQTRVTGKMKLVRPKDDPAAPLSVIVNPTLTLEGIPPTVLDYRLGNRSVLEWIIDQYQLTSNKTTGEPSDPNRADQPQYIVELIERVVHISLETNAVVAGLPGWR
jgi:predicted helicase